MTIKEIVLECLEIGGYAGLCYETECSCDIGDLMPCGEPNPDCEPGVKRVFPDHRCGCGERCEYHIVPAIKGREAL